MRVLCAFGEHNYGAAARGESYEHGAFVPALVALGHEVSVLDIWNRSLHTDFQDLNRALLTRVAEWKPHVLLAVPMHYEIWTESWLLVRDFSETATVIWMTDDSWKYSQFSRFVAPVFGAVATTYPEMVPRYLADGVKHVLATQWAATATSMRPPLPSQDCLFDATFVGTANRHRRHWVRRLHDLGVLVKCFGHGWPSGAVDATTKANIIRRSRISLNFSAGEFVVGLGFAGRSPQIKARTFEVPGYGGFLLSEGSGALEDYYLPGAEIEVFHTAPECAEKIRHYLAHPEQRDAVAAAGYARTAREHTYERRLATVLAFAVDSKQASSPQTDASAAIGGAGVRTTFEAVAARHTQPWLLRAVRAALIAIMLPVFGRPRGARAARRLVYEISWRLSGPLTYSARGLPGRLFYFES